MGELAKIEVFGGKALYGEVAIHGSKNAVLPILAASVLNQGISVIHNCPFILDVFFMQHILEEIGCSIKREGDTIIVDSTKVNKSVVTGERMKQLRSSILLLGALLGREKEAVISSPGGCSIGERPIDLHLAALQQLGMEVREEADQLFCTVNQLQGTKIALSFPSVGATENIILAAVLANGTTTILHAAKEPEIVELCVFLNGMGANIQGAGSDVIEICGVKRLHDVTYTLLPDRIVAGTYLLAVIGTGGEITLKNVPQYALQVVQRTLQKMGCCILADQKKVICRVGQRPKPIACLQTRPYPGFPTDLQSQIMAVLAIADGKSEIVETIFEARYKIVEALRKMGADIEIQKEKAMIYGRERLVGTKIAATDLRGGAALVLAGLFAQGKTIIENSHYIQRGYADIAGDFQKLGADICFIE